MTQEFSTTYSPLLSFSSLDWFVLGFSTLISFIVLIWVYKRSKKSKNFDWIDYLLMGRQLSLPLFVASLVSTWYGGVFGVTRIAFESGIYNFVTQGLFWYISYFIFAVFLVKRVYHTKSVSLAEMLGKAFGPKSEKLAGLFNFLNVVPAVYTISLAYVIQSFTGLGFSGSAFIGLLIVFSYSSTGGMRAIVLTDCIQFILMFSGVIAVIYFSVTNFGGLDFLKQNLDKSYFDPTGNHSLGTTFAWGLIALSTLVDPNFYHRVFSAKSESIARKSILISILFWFVFDICTTFGAMYAKVLIPTAAAETAYYHYALQILPMGFKGLFIGSILGCIFSTLDSYIFTASNTLLYDIIGRSLHLKKKYHILSNAFVCLLAYLLALSFNGNIKSIWKTLGSYSAACLLFPVLFYLLTNKKIKDLQFVSVCLVSAICVSVWRNIDLPPHLSIIDEIYIGCLVSALLYLYFCFSPKGLISKNIANNS